MSTRRTIYAKSGKRLFDLALTIPGFVLISPVLIAIALLVRYRLGSPVFFRQIRPGLNGEPFILRKFRTMTDDRDLNGKLLSDAQRLTKFGRFLRNSSLDELPELINVLKGEMSLIGPRPLLMQYLERYTPEQARRHEVRPGISGWAQINGRNEALFSERLKLDVWYVDNASLFFDIKILLLTIKRVLNRKGVIADQDVHEIDDIGLYSDDIGIDNDKCSNHSSLK